MSASYEYIINDCNPSIVIVSNDDQFNKIKNICERNISIKKIFSLKISELNNNSFINVNAIIEKLENISFDLKLLTIRWLVYLYI